MTIDISKIKRGDRVTLVPLEVEMVGVSAGNVRVHLDGPYFHYFNLDQIAAHHPAPREIGVGDRVHINGQHMWTGLVRSLDGDEAWVRWEKGIAPRSPIWPIHLLTLVEGDHERA
jgi:hypothetical protein